MVDCDVHIKFTIDGRVPEELQRGNGLTTADGEGHQSPVIKMKPGKHKLSWTDRNFADPQKFSLKMALRACADLKILASNWPFGLAQTSKF